MYIYRKYTSVKKSSVAAMNVKSIQILETADL